MDKLSECVLVIPARRWHMLGLPSGFTPATDAALSHLLDPQFFDFRPRYEVETDPSWLQLIPYQILTHNGDIWHYARGASGTETRLQSRGSVGIGGHIAREDSSDMHDVYDRGRLRELHEEVSIPEVLSESILGMIYDPATPVGEVHLGIVHRLNLKHPQVEAKEEGIVGRGFAGIDELLADADRLESWSVLALGYLRGRFVPGVVGLPASTPG